MHIYFELFSSFFKIGMFTFGGGFAMLPLIEKEMVVRKKWIGRDEIMDLFAAAQAIPGAIAINVASFIGYKIAGKKGSFMATLGVILPSFMIIIAVAALFMQIADAWQVAAVFNGINGGVVAMILISGFRMARSGIVDRITATLFTVTLIAVIFLGVSPIYLILLGAAVGLLRYAIEKKHSKEAGDGE